MEKPTPMLLGVSGPPGSGQKLVAQFLRHYGFMHYGFSAPVLRAVVALFGLSPTQLEGPAKYQVLPRFGLAPHRIVQDLGAFVRAHFGEELLLTLAGTVIEGARICGKPLVIMDVETERQAAFLREQGGRILHLSRNVASGVPSYAASGGLVKEETDLVVMNDTTITALYQKVAASLDLDEGAQGRRQTRVA